MIARFLEEHAGAPQVLYPGLPSHPQHALARRQMSGGGGMVALRTGGGQARVRRAHRLQLIAISNNLGDAKSLITHPATTTHQRFSAAERARLGITDDLLRFPGRPGRPGRSDRGPGPGARGVRPGAHRGRR